MLDLSQVSWTLWEARRSHCSSCLQDPNLSVFTVGHPAHKQITERKATGLADIHSKLILSL